MMRRDPPWWSHQFATTSSPSPPSTPDRPPHRSRDSEVEDFLPYSSSPAASATPPQRYRSVTHHQSQPRRAQTSTASRFLSAGRSSVMVPTHHRGPDHEGDDDDDNDDVSHIMTVPPSTSHHPRTAVAPTPTDTTYEAHTTNTVTERHRDLLLDTTVAMDEYFSNLMMTSPPATTRVSTVATMTQPISPFSTKRHCKRPRPGSHLHHHHNDAPNDNDDVAVSLSTCRTVSVVVSIPTVVDPPTNRRPPSSSASASASASLQHNPSPVFLFPVTVSDGTVNWNDENDIDANLVISSRSLMVVNPTTAFLGGDTPNLIRTAQQMAQQLPNQEVDDWTQMYQYHHIMWWSSQTAAAAAIETMGQISQAIVNDIIAPGSIAHRMVIATATTNTTTTAATTSTTKQPATFMTTMELQQTQQLFGHIGQQSVARVLSSSSSSSLPDDPSTPGEFQTRLYQQYGLAGLTVHGILQRLAQLNRADPSTTHAEQHHRNGSNHNDYYHCTVSIMEISTEGDDMLYDLLASRPFAKTKPHHGTVTLRYHPQADRRHTTPMYSVTGLSESSIDSVKQFGHLIRRAYTAALHTHRTSKRGHVIVTIQVHCGHNHHNPTVARPDRSSNREATTSCQFVDLALAGCDDDKSSKENDNAMSNASSHHSSHRRRNIVIRKSLWALSGVLRGMLLKEAGNDVPMPFRESILTKVLQRSMLQPDSRTILMATVAPEIHSYEESMTTLRYLNRLLHRPGQVIQSPFASGTNTSLSSPTSSPFPKLNDNESVVTSLQNLAEFAGQGRLLKELVSDPRQRLAKVLQPINHSLTSDSSPLRRQPEEKQDRFVLEDYIPSEYSDPEEDPPDSSVVLAPPFQPPESPIMAGTNQNTSFSPGEREELVEIDEHSETQYTAPTPPTRNVTKSTAPSQMASLSANAPPPSDLQDNNTLDRDTNADDCVNDSDNNMSAIYEVFHENRQSNYPRIHSSIKPSSTNPFDDNDDICHDANDILNESHTLDFMAAHVINNRLSRSAATLPEDSSALYFTLNELQSLDMDSDEKRSNLRALEEILRGGAGEEEIIFTNSLPSHEMAVDELDTELSTNQFCGNKPDNAEAAPSKSIYDVPSLESDIPLLDKFQHLNPPTDKSIPENNHVDLPNLDTNTANVESKQKIFGAQIKIPTASEYDAKVEGTEEPPFTMYDLPPESPVEVNSRHLDSKYVKNRENESNNHENGNSAKMHVDSVQEKDAEFWRDTDEFEQNQPNDQAWKASPISEPQASPLSNWSKTMPSVDSSLLSNDAGQKVQDEIDQLQAAVNNVKQTNISVWQSSLDSINNLRYFQTAHQEALAQLLVEKKLAKKEIERLEAELNRRSEVYRLSQTNFEAELEAAISKIAKVEMDRVEVVKIAEEAIGMQSELEQKVGELEKERSNVIASSISRQDYESLERLNEELQTNLNEAKYQTSKIRDELDESKLMLSQLECSVENLESTNNKLVDEVSARRNVVSSLHQLLREAQSAENDAIESSIEVQRLNDELRATESLHHIQIQDLIRDNKLKDEYVTKSRQETEVFKMELSALQEEARAETATHETEVSNLQQEIEQLRSNYSDYPAKLNEYERELSSLQSERIDLIRESQEAKASLQSRIADVRDLTDSLKGLLSDLDDEKAKNLQMETALASFQEETRSRVEIVVRHRNEAVSLLEKTVNENKSLVEVNVELQREIESLRRDRNNTELQIRKSHADYDSKLQNVTNENRTLSRTNQQLIEELAELRKSYITKRGEETHAAEPLHFRRDGRHAFHPQSSFDRHDNIVGSSRRLYDKDTVDPLDHDHDYEHDNDRIGVLEGANDVAAATTAEVVAAHIAYTAKSMIERNTSETANLKEKIYTIEDDTDYKMHALTQRLKQLERRVSDTTRTAKAPSLTSNRYR